MSLQVNLFSKKPTIPPPPQRPAPAPPDAPSPFEVSELLVKILGEYVGQPNTTSLVCRGWSQVRGNVLECLAKKYLTYPSIYYFGIVFKEKPREEQARLIVRNMIECAKEFKIPLPDCKADIFEITTLLPLTKKVQFHFQSSNLATFAGLLKSCLPPAPTNSIDFISQDLSSATRIERCTQWLTTRRIEIKQLNWFSIKGITMMPQEICLIENLQRLTFEDDRLLLLHSSLQKLKRLTHLEFKAYVQFDVNELIDICQKMPALTNVAILSQDLPLQKAFKQHLPKVEMTLLLEEETIQLTPVAANQLPVQAVT